MEILGKRGVSETVECEGRERGGRKKEEEKEHNCFLFLRPTFSIERHFKKNYRRKKASSIFFFQFFFEIGFKNSFGIKLIRTQKNF